LQLALDPCPGIVNPGMRISNRKVNLRNAQSLERFRQFQAPYNKLKGL
jgi:hypothetical protein